VLEAAPGFPGSSAGMVERFSGTILGWGPQLSLCAQPPTVVREQDVGLGLEEQPDGVGLAGWPSGTPRSRRPGDRPPSRSRTPRERLLGLVAKLRLLESTPDRPLPTGITLPEKDRPILLAALAAGASHLLTGDVTHFGRLYGTCVEGVLVLPPGRYLAIRSE